MLISIFTITFLSGLAIITLSCLSVYRQFQFWPPPNKQSWQYVTFWWLFRTMFFGLLTLCFIDFNGLATGSLMSWVIGGILTLFGFGMASYLTGILGWKNAHGENEGLQTKGFFNWSRNPIYVFSIIGMIGLGLLIQSAYVTMVLVIWTMMYILAPFLEETWLEQEYGKTFLEYKMNVPKVFLRTVCLLEEPPHYLKFFHQSL